MRIKFDKNIDHINSKDLNDYIICDQDTGVPEFVEIYADRGKDDTEFVMSFTFDEFDKFHRFIYEIYGIAEQMKHQMTFGHPANFVFKDYNDELEHYNK